MFKELVCHHEMKRAKRYLFLFSKSYKIGKALDNDIVLLEASAPPYLGTIEEQDGTYKLKSDHRCESLEERSVQVSGYCLHIRKYKWIEHAVAFAYSVLLLLGLAFLFFTPQENAQVEQQDSSVTAIETENLSELISSAKKFYIERGVQPGNLVRSIQILDRVRKSNEISGNAPSSDFGMFYKQVCDEKNRMIRDHRLAAKKFLQQGQKQKAKKVYAKLLQELIDPADPDRIQLLQEIRGG